MKNIMPKPRNERIANKNRDNVEKAFLGERIGAFNKAQEKIRLNDPDPCSPLYINEAERFNKDFCIFDQEKRKQELEKRKNRYETFKNVLFEREKKRWEKMDYDYMKNENKIMGNKEKVLVGKKNNPGMAFNPLTLEYDNSIQGEILKKRDEETKYRGLLRAQNIDKHHNSGYNILTGAQRNMLIPVDRPGDFIQKN